MDKIWPHGKGLCWVLINLLHLYNTSNQHELTNTHLLRSIIQVLFSHTSWFYIFWSFTHISTERQTNIHTSIHTHRLKTQISMHCNITVTQYYIWWLKIVDTWLLPKFYNPSALWNGDWFLLCSNHFMHHFMHIHNICSKVCTWQCYKSIKISTSNMPS